MTPQHYNKKIQPLDYIEANGLDFAEGNVIKYVTRYKEKGGLDDLLKAKDYLQVLINRLQMPGFNSECYENELEKLHKLEDNEKAKGV